MSQPTREELLAKIAALEAEVTQRGRTRVRVRNTRCKTEAKAAKDATKARKAQFKLEAQKRARLHCSLNRYAR